MAPKKSLVIGPRTRKNVLTGRNIRKLEDGGDMFEDYWTDDDDDASISARSGISAVAPQTILTTDLSNTVKGTEQPTLIIKPSNEAEVEDGNSLSTSTHENQNSFLLKTVSDAFPHTLNKSAKTRRKTKNDLEMEAIFAQYDEYDRKIMQMIDGGVYNTDENDPVAASEENTSENSIESPINKRFNKSVLKNKDENVIYLPEEKSVGASLHVSPKKSFISEKNKLESQKSTEIDKNTSLSSDSKIEENSVKSPAIKKTVARSKHKNKDKKVIDSPAKNLVHISQYVSPTKSFVSENKLGNQKSSAEIDKNTSLSSNTETNESSFKLPTANKPVTRSKHQNTSKKVTDSPEKKSVHTSQYASPKGSFVNENKLENQKSSAEIVKNASLSPDTEAEESSVISLTVNKTVTRSKLQNENRKVIDSPGEKSASTSQNVSPKKSFTEINKNNSVSSTSESEKSFDNSPVRKMIVTRSLRSNKDEKAFNSPTKTSHTSLNNNKNKLNNQEFPPDINEDDPIAGSEEISDKLHNIMNKTVTRSTYQNKKGKDFDSPVKKSYVLPHVSSNNNTKIIENCDNDIINSAKENFSSERVGKHLASASKHSSKGKKRKSILHDSSTKRKGRAYGKLGEINEDLLEAENFTSDVTPKKNSQQLTNVANEITSTITKQVNSKDLNASTHAVAMELLNNTPEKGISSTDIVIRRKTSFATCNELNSYEINKTTVEPSKNSTPEEQNFVSETAVASIKRKLSLQDPNKKTDVNPKNSRHMKLKAGSKYIEDGNKSTIQEPGKIKPSVSIKKRKSQVSSSNVETLIKSKTSKQRKIISNERKENASEQLNVSNESQNLQVSAVTQDPLSLKRQKNKRKVMKNIEALICKSPRKRYAPLARWRNERLIYSYEQGIPKVVGIDKGTNEDDAPLQFLLRKKQKSSIKIYKPKKAKLVVEDSKKQSLEVVKKFSLVPWTIPDERSKDDKNDYHIKRMFETCKSAFGYLQIAIGKEKPQQYMPRDDLHLTVIRGVVELTIQENSYKIGEKDMFIIPRGSAYGLKNVGKISALISFVVGKFKFLESVEE